jgi:hypothetical protein
MTPDDIIKSVPAIKGVIAAKQRFYDGLLEHGRRPAVG